MSGTWRQTTRLPAVMFKSLDEVKSLIKLDKICIDNNIFRLHYKATFVILLTASIIVTAKQYVGEHTLALQLQILGDTNKKSYK